MSKRHQASRRRSYGRRQHELHERPDLQVGAMSWLDDRDLADAGHRWGLPESRVADDWLRLRGVD